MLLAPSYVAWWKEVKWGQMRSKIGVMNQRYSWPRWTGMISCLISFQLGQLGVILIHASYFWALIPTLFVKWHKRVQSTSKSLCSGPILRYVRTPQPGWHLAGQRHVRRLRTVLLNLLRFHPDKRLIIKTNEMNRGVSEGVRVMWWDRTRSRSRVSPQEMCGAHSLGASLHA